MLLQFGVVQYLLKHSKWVDWGMVVLSREDFYQGMEEFRN